MNINATLIGQSIAFFVFAWFVYKYVWPLMMNAMRERQQTIATGLKNAEQAELSLATAEERAEEVVRDARQQAQQLIDQARTQSQSMIEAAKIEAHEESERVKEAAKADLDQEMNRAREQLRTEVASLAVSGAERILEERIDETQHRRLLASLASEL